jgi:hypothetical protein
MRSTAHSRLVSGCVLMVGLICLVLPRAQSMHAQSGSILVQESFEDSSFASRGWYDGTGGALSTNERYSGSRSFECRFAVGARDCSGGTPRRHGIADTDSTYLSFYIKHSASWVGSGKPYHPHMFHFVTNLDPAYVGPAYTHLTTYTEEISGVPMLGIQDAKNIDETRVGVDLTPITENRAVAGCNGDSDGYGDGECYPSGPVHRNGKKWKPGQTYFDNTPGSPRYKGDWHLVEAYFKLNSIVNGKGMKDGVLQYWYDGALILNVNNVVMRTGARPTMKFNQFILTPYIGDGSPVDQTFWLDNLMIATARPANPPPPPGGGGGTTAPSAPSNLRIVP